MPVLLHKFCPFPAALGGEMSAHEKAPGPAPAQTFQERTMNSQRATSEQRRERSELDPRFGKIGISAVAAAMRYGSDARNPAYAPAKLADNLADEAAA
jgi:hypothetical protein